MDISIITVCYNSERTIADTIKSVLAQDYADYEHIIVDGASHDATMSVVSRLSHDRLKAISEPDRGLYDAMNKGLALAKGQLIGILNSDDYFSRIDALSIIAAAANAHLDFDAVSAGLEIVDPDDLRRVRRVYRAVGFRRWMLRFGHMPPHPGFYIRRSALERLGSYEISHPVSSDFDWLVRFYYAHNMRSDAVPEPIVTMRGGGLSMRGWRSSLAINRDIGRALRANGVWSAIPLIWSKYIVKAWQIVGENSESKVPMSVRWQPHEEGSVVRDGGCSRGRYK